MRAPPWLPCTADVSVRHASRPSLLLLFLIAITFSSISVGAVPVDNTQINDHYDDTSLPHPVPVSSPTFVRRDDSSDALETANVVFKKYDVAPYYEYSDEDGWHRSGDWKLNGRSGVDYIASDTSSAASSADSQVQNDSTSSSASQHAVSNTDSSSSTAITSVSSDDIPTSWTAKRERTDLYAVPIIIVASILLCISIVVVVALTVTFKAKRGRNSSISQKLSRKHKNESSSFSSQNNNSSNSNTEEERSTSVRVTALSRVVQQKLFRQRKRNGRKRKPGPVSSTENNESTEQLQSQPGPTTTQDRSDSPTPSALSQSQSYHPHPHDQTDLPPPLSPPPHPDMQSSNHPLPQQQSESNSRTTEVPVVIIRPPRDDEEPSSTAQPPAYRRNNNQNDEEDNNDNNNNELNPPPPSEYSMSSRQREKQPAVTDDETDNENSNNSYNLYSSEGYHQLSHEQSYNSLRYQAHVATDDKQVLTAMEQLAENAPSSIHSHGEGELSSSAAVVPTLDDIEEGMLFAHNIVPDTSSLAPRSSFNTLSSSEPESSSSSTCLVQKDSATHTISSPSPLIPAPPAPFESSFVSTSGSHSKNHLPSAPSISDIVTEEQQPSVPTLDDLDYIQDETVPSTVIQQHEQEISREDSHSFALAASVDLPVYCPRDSGETEESSSTHPSTEEIQER